MIVKREIEAFVDKSTGSINKSALNNLEL